MLNRNVTFVSSISVFQSVPFADASSRSPFGAVWTVSQATVRSDTLESSFPVTTTVCPSVIAALVPLFPSNSLDAEAISVNTWVFAVISEEEVYAFSVTVAPSSTSFFALDRSVTVESEAGFAPSPEPKEEGVEPILNTMVQPLVRSS